MLGRTPSFRWCEIPVGGNALMKFVARYRTALVLSAALMSGVFAAGPARAAITDEYGTHEGQLYVGTSFGQAIVSPAAGNNRPCGNYAVYGGGFDVNLGGGWTWLAARRGPCRAAVATGGHGIGGRFHVYREVIAELVCHSSQLAHYGSSVWYKTDQGWSWSGGTSQPQWNVHGKGCGG